MVYLECLGKILKIIKRLTALMFQLCKLLPFTLYKAHWYQELHRCQDGKIDIAIGIPVKKDKDDSSCRVCVGGLEVYELAIGESVVPC